MLLVIQLLNLKDVLSSLVGYPFALYTNHKTNLF